MIKLRGFQSSDAEQIAQLFLNTIRCVNLDDYTEEQIRAWAPDDIHFRDCKAKCSSKFTLVVETNGIIAGFAELDNDSHIDCFYCHKDFQGHGIGKLLFNEIEKEAQKQGLVRLFVEASITTNPFFVKMGFSVVKEQIVKMRGVEFRNFRKEKYL